MLLNLIDRVYNNAGLLNDWACDQSHWHTGILGPDLAPHLCVVTIAPMINFRQRNDAPMINFHQRNDAQV